MRRIGMLLVLASLLAPAARAQVFVDDKRTVAIDPSRGADRDVDYTTLVRFGPWDDRNYRLTREDLALLSPNEAEQREPVPAFFRVGMRRAWPSLRRSGPAQYPRSALPIFRRMFGGYLIDGKLYRGVQRVGERFDVVLENGVDAAGFTGGTDFVSGEVRVTSPIGAAESAIKVSPADTNKVVAGTNGPGGDQKMHYSTDGGQTWTQTTLPLGGTCCDPAVDWSSDGQFAYATTLGGCGFGGCQLWFYRSGDGGQTWNDLENVTMGDPRREVTSGQSDKEYVHVDQHAASPHKDNIYLTWHQGNVLQFAVSTDFGNTFTKQSFSSANAEIGLGSDITTDRNGHVYYVWPAYDSQTIRLKKSTDGGMTFANSVVIANTEASYAFPLPSIEAREVFVYTSAGADLSDGPFAGSVYVAWTDSTGPTSFIPPDNHGRIRVAYSRDGGASWTVSTPHETADADSVDRWHQWLAVGPDGTVHIVFYDTRRDPGRTSVDLFYSFSSDGGETWSTPDQVTTVMSPNIADGFEYGDYNGLDIVLNDLIAIFTDNRSESGGGGDSVDVYAAGIVPGVGSECGNAHLEVGEACDGADLGGQACVDFGCSGGTLGCLADCSALDLTACTGCPGAGRVPDGNAVPGTPLRASWNGAELALSWSAACGAADDYAVYEGELGLPGSATLVQCSTGGATSAAISPAAGNRFYLAVPVSGGLEGSYGRKSDGSERPTAATACFPQQLGTCP